MSRYICIHGHFYQPPRENAWLEAVELQDSAFPYHDWNERVTAECYAPNAFARRLDGTGRIDDIVNNYARISFNFGPTVLAWMQDNTPDVHQAIVEADRESRQRFGGHGSAVAQVFNHMILPLANARDKHTQVYWGIRDFQSRFGRSPEGMWLAETAADLPTLDTLAELGIRFTILSPYQAKSVRPLEGDAEWTDVNGGRVDPKQPYLVKLPSGREIAVFFYDAPVSQAVAFEGLLNSGDRFADRLLGAFVDEREEDQLVHIATDGESYGHHHRHGEMAMAAALNRIEEDPGVSLTNYGLYLEQHPPTQEASIHEPSAWSCPHGVGRWYTDCGCNTGGRHQWNQAWRGPLREALDWLRDAVVDKYAERAAALLTDPWAARNDYIQVILDRSDKSLRQFLEQHARAPVDQERTVTTLRFLELQRHAMLMYTSCGWFFDELSGIESVQVLHYAGRVIQLAAGLLDLDLEPGFLDILQRAKSNIPAHRDGRYIYEKFVKPAMVDREKLCAHYAVSSLFESYGETDKIYAFTCRQHDRQIFEAGKARLAFGRATISFDVTRSSDELTYGVLHLGDHNLNCGVRVYQGPEAYQQLGQEISDAFGRADFPQVIRLMDKHFGESNYSLKSLFRDEQRKVLRTILASAQEEMENRFRQITDAYTPLMRFLEDLHAPLPAALQAAYNFILNIDLRREFESEAPGPERVHQLLDEVQTRNVELSQQGLGYAAKNALQERMIRLHANPEDLELLRQTTTLAAAIQLLPFEVNLWKSQNTYYRMRESIQPRQAHRATTGDKAASAWLEAFAALGDQLGFNRS